MAFSPAGAMLAIASDHRISLWDRQHQWLVRSFIGHTGTVQALAFDRSGKVEEATPQEAEGLQQRMAHEFGADIAATDVSRVLRLPGFANRKYDGECVVRATKHSDKTYNLRDFKIGSGPAKSNRTLEQSPPRLGNTRETVTQSERDWAYAKRALARGDDPEEIIRRIADYRADEKHDPEYYARLTVRKAQAHSQNKSPKAAQPADVAQDGSRDR
jgi:RepB DNA-primase from phage plasmid